MNAANDNSNHQSLLKSIFVLSKWLGLITFVTVGFFLGDDVKGSNQKDIVNFLITISAIVFGVMGAWLSIMKVELQSGIDNAATNDQANDYMSRARGLIEPITISSFVLIGSILFSLAYYILPSLDVSLSALICIKKISFSLISLGAYAIIYSISMIVYFGADFLLGMSFVNQEKRANRQRNHYNQ